MDTKYPIENQADMEESTIMQVLFKEGVFTKESPMPVTFLSLHILHIDKLYKDP